MYDSMSVCQCQYVCLTVRMSACMSVCMSICLFVCMYVRMAVSLHKHLSYWKMWDACLKLLHPPNSTGDIWAHTASVDTKHNSVCCVCNVARCYPIRMRNPRTAPSRPGRELGKTCDHSLWAPPVSIASYDTHTLQAVNHVYCWTSRFYTYIIVHTFLDVATRTRAMIRDLINPHLGEHKPGRIEPGRIKRAALSLQNQNGYTFDVCRAKHPGTKQLPIHISAAGFEANLQIWFLGTTPFDTTPFICLRHTGTVLPSTAATGYYNVVLLG